MAEESRKTPMDKVGKSGSESPTFKAREGEPTKVGGPDPEQVPPCGARGEGDDELTWTVRLYERAPEKRYIVFLFAIGAALVGLFAFQNVIFAVIALVAVLASTAEFWMPLQYKLDKNRASVRCGFSVTAIEWSDVRRVITSEEGWKLSPLKEETRLSPFRGVYLRFGPVTEDAKAFVKSHINGDVRFVEQRPDPGRGGPTPIEGGVGDQKKEVGDAGNPGS